MEVCIFGVLTVNLLTFPLRAPLFHQKMRSLPMPAKDDCLSLGRKKLKLLVTAHFTGLYDDWREA